MTSLCELRKASSLTILGESGSGKTTLLRIIAGFESANSGEILMEGERLDLFRRTAAASIRCFNIMLSSRI